MSSASRRSSLVACNLRTRSRAGSSSLPLRMRCAASDRSNGRRSAPFAIMAGLYQCTCLDTFRSLRAERTVTSDWDDYVTSPAADLAQCPVEPNQPYPKAKPRPKGKGTVRTEGLSAASEKGPGKACHGRDEHDAG